MDLRRLNQALRAAFDTGSLTRLLKTAFNEDLEEITQGKNYREKVFEVVRWAERTGNLNMLLIEASRENPDNPILRELLEATFVDAPDVVTDFVTGWENGVANEFFNQILLLNQALAELRGEVKQLRNDLNDLTDEKGMPVHDKTVSRRMEVLMVVLIGVLIFIGLSMRGVF